MRPLFPLPVRYLMKRNCVWQLMRFWIAGGPKADTEYEIFEFVYDGIQKGAIGINLGRNIWQNDYPVAMMRAIRGIIHENATPKKAQEIYDSIKSGKQQ